MNFAAQDVREDGIDSGLSDIELGLRLRYETAASSVPMSACRGLRKVGDTARLARRDGELVSSTSLVLGMRIWF